MVADSRRRILSGPGATKATSSLVLLVAAAAAVVAVALPVNQLTQPGGVVSVPTLDPGALGSLSVPGLPEDGFLQLDPTAGGLTYYASSLPWPLRLLTEAGPSVMALCTAVGAWLLWRLLRDIAAGRPFHPRNPLRIGGIAVAILIGVIAGGLLQNIATATVMGRSGIQFGEPPFRDMTVMQVSLAPVIVAFVLFIVADVFRRGRQLSEDVEGLV